MCVYATISVVKIRGLFVEQKLRLSSSFRRDQIHESHQLLSSMGEMAEMETKKQYDTIRDLSIVDLIQNEWI